MERPRLKRDWKGLKVKTLYEIRNGYTRISKGTICTVVYSRGGLSLEAPKCPHCGVSVFVSKVSEGEVVIVE